MRRPTRARAAAAGCALLVGTVITYALSAEQNSGGVLVIRITDVAQEP